MKGKPKYKCGETVSFKLGDEVISGTIEIIDMYGSYFDDTDVCYDILANNILYKHINEQNINGTEDNSISGS